MSHFACTCSFTLSTPTATTDTEYAQRTPSCVTLSVPGIRICVDNCDVNVARLVIGDRQLVAIGDARLEFTTDSCRPDPGETDLAFVLKLFARKGIECLRLLDGEFALVIADSAGCLILARDAFGVVPLYYATRQSGILAATTAEAIGDRSRLNMSYVADFLVNGSGPQDTTIYDGVLPVRGGCAIVASRSGVVGTTYWEPPVVKPLDGIGESEATEEFRRLFCQSVAAKVSGQPTTWAHLSGGLDSSSIVCIAQHMAGEAKIPNGLAGTITLSDQLGAGNEVAFVDAVLRDYPLPNMRIADWWPWRDDGRPPAPTDQPTPECPYYSRDRFIEESLQAAGCGVVLTGVGADHYMGGHLTYMADYFTEGRLGTVAHELWQWAVAKRVSVYQMARTNIVHPLMPQALRRYLHPRSARVPAWLAPEFRRRFNPASYLFANKAQGGPIGHKFQTTRALEVREIGRSMRPRGPSGLRYRYPYLSRELVAFALALPPSMVIRPHARKWILRSAMRGVLPDEVRLRRGKGGTGARVRWALNTESRRIALLTRSLVLEELGCVRGDVLRREVERVQAGRARHVTELYTTLALETWLQIWAGRWPEKAEVAAA